MNDEIKEILDKLKDSQYIPSDDNRTYKLLDRDDTRYLLDYITNLQKEKEDYKSRVEKASEKLGNYKHYSTPTEEQNRENEDIVDSALNILQNGSDASVKK